MKKTYKPTMSHNACYGTVTRFAGVVVRSWNVRAGDLVYDSDLRKYGIVEEALPATKKYPASLYVRFRSEYCDGFTANYSVEWAEKILFVVDNDCYLICRNGYLVYGSRCYNSLFADAVDCVVTQIDKRHNQAFLRPVADGSFGCWVSAADIVCNFLVK